MAKKRISLRKRIHEAGKYLRYLQARIHDYTSILVRIDKMTINIAQDGTGWISVPPAQLFERASPRTAPQGLVFVDGSFLALKEIFRYDYPEDDDEPKICRREYSFIKARFMPTYQAYESIHSLKAKVVSRRLRNGN